MDLNREYASKGVAGAGLGTGIAGLALGVLNAAGGLAGLSGLFGPNRTNNIAADDLVSAMIGAALVRSVPNSGCCNSDGSPVTQKELEMAQEIAALKTQNALKDADAHTDEKNLEMYRYIDEKLKEIASTLGAQAIQNQATKDSFQLLQERLECLRKSLETSIETEAKERRCGDNAIVNYVNATFYPKMVADVTTGTTTTAQQVYNPLPACTCDCGR